MAALALFRKSRTVKPNYNWLEIIDSAQKLGAEVGSDKNCPDKPDAITSKVLSYSFPQTSALTHNWSSHLAIAEIRLPQIKLMSGGSVMLFGNVASFTPTAAQYWLLGWRAIPEVCNPARSRQRARLRRLDRGDGIYKSCEIFCVVRC